MMKRLGILSIGVLMFVGRLHAGLEHFDIYGVDATTQEKIYQCCTPLLEEHLNFLTRVNTDPALPDAQTERRQKYVLDQLKSRLRGLGDFSIIELSNMYYPETKETYATLDLVRAEDSARMPEHSKAVSKGSVVASKEVKELLALWEEYNERNLYLMRAGKLNPGEKSCPVMHCTWGFDEKERKEILPKLQKGVATHKAALMEIIKHGAQDKERANALAILGNNEHSPELTRLLMDLTDDPSDSVRNSAMGLLVVASRQDAARTRIDINPIIKALNYPYASDRNQAAAILLERVKRDPSVHALVKTEAGDTLLELLKLQQPSNHELAYDILKVISHKNYGEREYQRWERWLSSQNASL